MKDELLVKFDTGYASEAVASVHERVNATILERLGETGWQRVRLADGSSVAKAIEQYKKFPAVLAAQPNFYYELTAVPDDPQYSNAGLWGLPKISAPAAWDITTGSNTVIVAVIDTGMRLGHEDLAANLWLNPGEIANNGIDDDGNGYTDDANGWDFRFEDSDPTDQHGHGTHVAGTIGAVGNNATGVVGVNWNVRIMPIKIYSQAANDTTSAMLINAYNYVRMMKLAGHNIRVTNNSYGGCAEACGYDQATKDAVDALGDAGVLNVFSAGNNGRNTDNLPFYPGSYDSPGILNVAASTSVDSRASFSNFGVVSVDLAAPGAGIYSTTNGSNSSYGISSGTSMAAPHVAGVAALLAAQHPSLDARSLKATIMNNVDVLQDWAGVVKTSGRLNAAAALQNPVSCTADVGPLERHIPTKGGLVQITVNTQPNCDFAVKPGSRWIRVLDRNQTSGSAVVDIFIGVNPSISRSSTLEVGGQTIVLTQNRSGGK
ncbi:MAG TPA: S8 family peptidase [Pyrinomonadaceae bacterium]|nr:S8 family peptidase [Pyrinomonadaceae bacterium]